MWFYLSFNTVYLSNSAIDYEEIWYWALHKKLQKNFNPALNWSNLQSSIKLPIFSETKKDDHTSNIQYKTDFIKIYNFHLDIFYAANIERNTKKSVLWLYALKIDFKRQISISNVIKLTVVFIYSSFWRKQSGIQYKSAFIKRK